MLFCKKTKLDQYNGLSTVLDEALATVSALDSMDIGFGRKDISENVYVNCTEYRTCDNSEQLYETHEKYGDIHLSLKGTEVIQIADVKKHMVIETDQENDYVGTRGEWESCVRLTPEDVLIVFPGEAHRLKGCLNQPETVKKVIVKFLVKQ